MNTIAMPADTHDHANAGIPMPRLTDDAVVQIHDFIAHFLDLFEAHYGDQIHRYYDDERSAHSMIKPDPLPDTRGGSGCPNSKLILISGALRV